MTGVGAGKVNKLFLVGGDVGGVDAVVVVGGDPEVFVEGVGGAALEDGGVVGKGEVDVD